MKLQKFLNSISFRISVALAVAIAATTISVGEMILAEEKKTLELELKSKGMYLAELMSHSMIGLLLRNETASIFSLLTSSVQSRENLIVHAAVHGADGNELAKAYLNEEYRKKMSAVKFEEPLSKVYFREDRRLSVYHFSIPIIEEASGAIGFLSLSITKGPLLAKLKNIRQRMYVMGAVIIFIGIMLGLWMTRRILKPIIILNDGVKMVGEGELGVEVPVVGTGEVRELAMSFNRMSRRLKELIDTIQSAQEHLIRTEKLYAIGEFSAGIAHEIKNPLTSIKMLMQTSTHKKQSLTDEDIRIIEEEINRIDHIVKQFLAFARPEKSEKTDLVINEVIEEVVTITRPNIDRASIHLIRKYSPELPVIKGDRDALKQALLNLVLNAIQSMEPAGGELLIETFADDTTLSIVIKDSGNGIPEKDLNRIFDPFFTTKEEGTGMGLTLTYNIINDHCGTINVESSPGKGTTVTVYLPAGG